MDEAPRAELLSRVRSVVTEQPDPVDLAYVTDTYIARKHDRARPEPAAG